MFDPRQAHICGTFAEFCEAVPEADQRYIVVGRGEAFDLSAPDEPVLPGSAIARAICEYGWLPRGFVGTGSDGRIVIVHHATSPDEVTMQAAADLLARIAADEVRCLQAVAALEDPRT